MKLFPRNAKGKIDLQAYLSLPKHEQEEAEIDLKEHGTTTERLFFSQMQKNITDDEAARAQPKAQVNPDKMEPKRNKR